MRPGRQTGEIVLEAAPAVLLDASRPDMNDIQAALVALQGAFMANYIDPAISILNTPEEFQRARAALASRLESGLRQGEDVVLNPDETMALKKSTTWSLRSVPHALQRISNQAMLTGQDPSEVVAEQYPAKQVPRSAYDKFLYFAAAIMVNLSLVAHLHAGLTELDPRGVN